MFNPDQDHLSSLEERLRSWVPSAGGLDRDRMLFEAGRAEARGSARMRGLEARDGRRGPAGVGAGMAWHNERSQRRALELAFARLVLLRRRRIGLDAQELITEQPGDRDRCRSHELPWPDPAGETPGRRGEPRAAQTAPTPSRRSGQPTCLTRTPAASRL